MPAACRLRRRPQALGPLIEPSVALLAHRPDRAHLAEGFFRATDGRVRQQGGAGLGLALVKHIIDAHNGSLDVESRLVKGTTFRIFLPVAETE